MRLIRDFDERDVRADLFKRHGEIAAVVRMDGCVLPAVK